MVCNSNNVGNTDVWILIYTRYSNACKLTAFLKRIIILVGYIELEVFLTLTSSLSYSRDVSQYSLDRGLFRSCIDFLTCIAKCEKT